MARKAPLVLENNYLKVQISLRDLAAHVTVKATGETLRMAGAQKDDVLLSAPGGGVWKSFAGAVASIREGPGQAIHARLPALGLGVQIRLEESDVVFEVAPAGIEGRMRPRDVLYPRHFLLPKRPGAYATFPFGQGSIIPTDFDGIFHHREGYAEAVAHWLGGYTGRTGYCGIAETPHDVYQAVDHRANQPASVFFHWLGSLGELRYARVARYHFAEDFGYVKQAKHYRQHCKDIGWFRSMADKAAENPNVKRLIGAPIVCVSICSRREVNLEYVANKFTDVAGWVEEFRKKSGIKNAVVHVDGWGLWGYDAMHPDTIPPNRECGGAAGLSEMAARVKKLGYLFGLHDQYIDYFFHAPSYDQKWSIVLESGESVRINRWCGGPCGHLCYTQIPQYVKRNIFEGVHRSYPINHNSPSVWEIAAPTAYYLDCFCRGGVECWSKDHPMTRGEGRQIHNEIFQMVRNGADGQGIVLSVEHPRDYSIPYLDFGWGIGHFTADVPNVAGTLQTQAIGTPVPLWHLVFHDALCLPGSGADLAETLLYAQAPYFWLRGEAVPAAEVSQKKTLLKLHEDAAFAEMTGHELLSEDGSVQKCTYARGLEVEVDKAKGTYRINTGRAKTRGTKSLR